MSMPTAPASTPKIAFVSGPIDASTAYFETHYVQLLDTAVNNGHSFIMGPVPGVDTLTLHYLLSLKIDPKRITVYMAHFEYAHETRRKELESLKVGVQEVNSASVATTTRMRDECMTRESDYDILRYRTEEEAKEFYGNGWWPRVSNTEVNERRRRGDVGLDYRGGLKEQGTMVGKSKRVGAETDERKRASVKDKVRRLFSHTKE